MGKIFFSDRMPLRFWLLTAICPVLPDFDVIGFVFGIRYGDVLGHRGITHSFFFALVLAGLVVLLFFRELRPGRTRAMLFFYFFIITASHSVLDALTNGGLGVAFFAPLNNDRYFFPWRPLEVSPIGIEPFLSGEGIEVFVSEAIWIWAPSAILVAGIALIRRLRRTKSYPTGPLADRK